MPGKTVLRLLGSLATGLFIFLSILVFNLDALARSQLPEKKSQVLVKEVRIGILAHDVDYLWSNLHLEDGIDYNLEILFRWPHASLFSGTFHPNLGVIINDRGNTNQIYAGFLWEWTNRHGFFLDLGLGAVVHDGELNVFSPDRKLLGCRILFRIPLEFGFRISNRFRLSLMFSHISNAYTAEYNQGLDVLGIRCGYDF